MFTRVERRAGPYCLLCGVAALLFLTNLGGASLWDLDEGRNATAAFEMRESGNWIVPTFNAQLRVDKPALLYWLQVAAYNLFGVNEFSARLPSALAALATVLLVYELARGMFGGATGLLAGVVVASTPMLCGAARFANPDALLNLFTVLTLTLFWLGLAWPRTTWFLAMGAAAGLAVLAKGPVGFVLPATILGTYLLWERRWSLLLERRWALSFLIMLLVALPWYVWVAVETRAGFLQGFIMQHNVGRFLSPLENHRGSPLYYPVVLLVGLAPWSVFAAPALWYAAWSTVRVPAARCQSLWQGAVDAPEGNMATTSAYRLLWSWTAVYLLFFTVAQTKLPNYVLPVVAPCAVFVARLLERWRSGLLRLPTWVVGGALLALLLVGIGVGAALALAGGMGDLALLRGRTFTGLGQWSLLGILPIVGALLGTWYWRRQQPTGFVVSVALCAILLLAPLAAYGSAVFNGYKAPRCLVEEAGACQRDEEIRVGCWNLEYLPSLNFYLQRDVVHLHAEGEVGAFLTYPLAVYLFLPAEDWERLAPGLPGSYRIAARQRDMYRHRDILVVSNR